MRELLRLADLLETVDGAGEAEAEAQADVEVALRLDLVDMDKEVESAPRLPWLGASGSEDIFSEEVFAGLTGE